MDLVVPDTVAGRRLDVFLAETVPGVSRVFLQRVIRDGGVQVDGRECRVQRFPVSAGMNVALFFPAVAVHADQPAAEAIGLSVLHEDEHLLVIDKPAGMVVHPAAGVRTGTLVNALLARYPGFAGRFADSPLRPGIVHRLDKDTSGCLAVALDKPSQLYLAKSFAEREVRKTYLALVLGHSRDSQGEIRAALGRHPVDRHKMAVRDSGGRYAITRYQVLRHGQVDGIPVSLMEVVILTGRTHQIRVHMAALRTPVIGDTTYGGRQALPAPRQLLHAWKLSLRHPATGQPCAWEAPLPEDFRAVLARLQDTRPSA
jgi:23S rRNA pseudouridine1911/1915/1917 synthase